MMKRINLKRIKETDLISKDALLECYKAYLKNELGYDEFEVEIASMDMNNPYNFEALIQDYVGDCEIDGVEYSVRFCHTDFCRCGLFRLSDVNPFEFYMLFDKSTMSGNAVGAYMNANKKYIV